MSSRLETGENLERDDEVALPSERSFGLVFTAFFLAVALLPLIKGHNMRRWALIPAALFLVITLVAPLWLRPLNRVWLAFGLLLHRVTNPVILGLLFYLVFAPFGVLFRLMGKKFLHLKFESGLSSYWLPRDPPGPPPGSMGNQF